MIMGARRRRGWSQQTLAGRLCTACGLATVSRHEVSRWERGTRLPSAYWLGPLAALLGIDRVDFDRAVVQARNDRRRSRPDVDDVLSQWHVTRVAYAAAPLHLAERRVVTIGVVDVAAPADHEGCAGQRRPLPRPTEIGPIHRPPRPRRR
jgi:transcriptional regulator with XRE-family HTH domain